MVICGGKARLLLLLCYYHYLFIIIVESYGAWGKEALEAFSMLASRLATSSSRPKSMVLSELYGRLNLHLVRANVRAILSCHHQEYI